MSTRTRIMIIATSLLALFLSACASPNPQPAGLTPIPSLAPGTAPTLAPALQTPSQGGEMSAPVAAAQADGALGAPLFLLHCSPCHGREGEGVTAPALRNSDYIQTAGDQAILGTIAKGRAGTTMPAWLQANGGPLTDADINNVIAYVKTFQKVSPMPKATPIPPEPTETPGPANAPTPEPAHPSEPGRPGPAATLAGDATRGKGLFGHYCAICHGPDGMIGLPNPDSDDGAVPALNPIDETIADPDSKKFASNLDVFIEHGSTPAGSSPLLRMPSFGDSKLLTDQQIADMIAYMISLNTK
jgi:mono/diheme cytochrome c family protein